MLGLSVAELIVNVITLFIALPLHELGHAWTAVQLGDDSPRYMGRLTLNPLAHLDPLGSLMMVVAGFGWAKPVMVQPYRLRYGPRLGMMLVAAAGPFTNFVLALLAAIPFRLGLLQPTGANPNPFLPSLEFFLTTFLILNLYLMLFNLIPLGPLDGLKVLRGLAPPDWERVLMPLEQYGAFILLALIMLGRFGGNSLLGLILNPPMLFLLRTILG
jgi:Zn-dependent protease